MKQTLLSLLLFFVGTVSGLAQSKRIASMEIEIGTRHYTSTFSYDDQERISQIQFTEDSDGRPAENNTVDYSYSGDDINISHAYNSGTDTYAYHITDGKVQTGEVFLDVDMVNENFTFSYDGDNLSEIVCQYKSKEIRNVYSWTGSNPSKNTEYYKGKLDMEYTYTHNTMSTHPLMHVLFGGIAGEGGILDLDEMIPLFALYNYLGTIPANLISEISQYDAYEGDSSELSVSYETDANDDVVKVTATRGSRTSVFIINWEGTDGIKNIVSPSRSNKEYFTLDGQHLQNQPTKKGIYIFNDRKVVVK